MPESDFAAGSFGSSFASTFQQEICDNVRSHNLRLHTWGQDLSSLNWTFAPDLTANTGAKAAQNKCAGLICGLMAPGLVKALDGMNIARWRDSIFSPKDVLGIAMRSKRAKRACDVRIATAWWVRT